MPDKPPLSSERSIVPIPDPTLLTTQQLIRENVWLREVIETRLDGMDKAIELLQRTADKFPDRIDEKIKSLSDVHEEKFASIQVQFAERDVRTEQTSRDSKVAVDAALTAQKEVVAEQNRSSATAIAKSETATMKQIDQLANMIASSTKTADDKIVDLKERLTRIEGGSEGRVSSVKASQSTLHLVIAGFALLLSVATTIFTVWHFGSTMVK